MPEGSETKGAIKCDGAKPECVHCLDAKLNCQYTEYKKRGPHKGYVRLLEDQLLTQPKLKTESDEFPPEEIVTHLIDLFFQHINSVFPFVHRARLKKSIQDGNVSKPLIWGVMAIAARFSDHPSIKSDPPYWAGETFATKAISLINSSLLEPTIPNLQFWGIMSCLEYGRASGAKAWIYGGIAVRICQELGLNKEETLTTPIVADDGTIDYVAMALRRRIFWSCLCIDNTSTNRPQGFEICDYDVKYPTLQESSLLRDPLQGYTIDKHTITDDPLMNVIPNYISVLERFGEVSKFMSRAKTTTSAVTWPPIAEAASLHAMMKNWHDTLPEAYHFNAAHVKLYKETASQNYISFWLCAHAMYCTGMLALHRGSLAYSDLTAADLPQDVYDRIQSSIQECKVQVETAMGVFRALHDICGLNVLPYMCYCAYIFSTVLMTSAFSSDPVSYRKSSAGLVSLYDMIELLRPYWPMSERLASTTRDMLSAHSRLYDIQEQQEFPYESKRFIQNSPDIDSLTSISTVETSLPITSTAPYPFNNVMPVQANMSIQQPILPPYQVQQQQQAQDIDFNSCEFLYDSALFGQIIFDSTKSNNSDTLAPQQNPYVLNTSVNYQQPYNEQLKNTSGSWGPS
ncbi:hypothetical protein INT48_008791 [Thamnidium elegans]|uniref:Xylanolytic transcriptional activator regulatory domain-containing protein n=1 Tax=Thamnidium elegans TaxID=101142 RepID=A0A8H7SK20_9FUNG|nr:hypothetical protein INT48_008791 [Thamnidium elegans]